MALIVRRVPAPQPLRVDIGHAGLVAEEEFGTGRPTVTWQPAADVKTQPAASVKTQGPDLLWILAGYGLVVAGAAIGWGLFAALDPKPFVAAAGFSAFAPLYVLAQSIERVMEPFVKYVGSAQDTTNNKTDTAGSTNRKEEERLNQDEAKALLESAIAKLNNGTGDAEVAAHYLALVGQIRRNTTVIAWGIASAAGMILCGIFGFRLLSATGLDVPWDGLDVVVTGLAVGSGTKPLHDLISNMQKSKDAKSDPDEAATSNT